MTLNNSNLQIALHETVAELQDEAAADKAAPHGVGIMPGFQSLKVLDKELVTTAVDDEQAASEGDEQEEVLDLMPSLTEPVKAPADLQVPPLSHSPAADTEPQQERGQKLLPLSQAAAGSL